MDELLKPFVDDRIRCGDCQHFGKKIWGGKCQSGNVYFLDTLHRCDAFKGKSVVKIQQSKNTWEEGDQPFWL